MNRQLEPIRTAELTLPIDVRILAGKLAASSIEMYKRDFTAYVLWAMQQGLEPLTASTLKRWVTFLANETEMSPNTINRMVSAVKRLVLEAAEQDYTSHEIAAGFEQVRGVQVKALKERIKPNARTRISPDAMRQLTEAPNTRTLVGIRDVALLHTLASSALRVSELASLKQKQVRRSGDGYLLSVKGKNETEYEDAYLSSTAYDAIQTWLDARQAAGIVSAYIFTSFAGRGDARATHDPMTEEAVWQTIVKYAEQVGLENVKPHDLRRFVGTRLAKQDIRKAQKALRHKSIETTARHYVLDELEPGLTDNLY